MKPADPLAYLPPDVAAAFETVAAASGIAAKRRVVSYRRLAEVAAARHLIAQFEEAGSCRTTAITRAALRLGVEPDTLRRRLYRWAA